MENYELIMSDFNEIAELGDDPKWNHNNCYYKYLLRFVPSGANECLDIGCGKGELSRLLSQRAKKVIAVDIADRMIEYAKEHNTARNINYICANIFHTDIEDGSLDIVITAATAHHLPFGRLLEFSMAKLKSGGRLIILDIAKASSLTDLLVWGFAFFPNIFMNIVKNGRLHKDDPHAAAVWRRHGEHDVYMTVAEIKSVASEHIPGAKVTRKLFWRYVLIWTKP